MVLGEVRLGGLGPGEGEGSPTSKKVTGLANPIQNPFRLGPNHLACKTHTSTPPTIVSECCHSKVCSRSGKIQAQKDFRSRRVKILQ